MMTPPSGDDSSLDPGRDPREILQEARRCAASGVYAEALEHHLWFHRHALDHRPSLYGVRLSYALHDWVALGAVYPPALEALRETRDECDVRMRSGEGDRWVFNDLAAINRVLRAEHQTLALFAWLDTHLPSRAAEVYETAQPLLVRARQYRVCGRYLDPDASLQRLRGILQARTQLVTKDPRYDIRFEARSQRNFAVDAATMVALLVLNDRREDAERIAEQALTDLDTAEFQDLLDKARRGQVPPQRR
jgi:hypothetical protein